MCRQDLILMKRSTPMTYYYIVQSLLSRCAWMDSAVRLISQPTISAPFQLAWKTQQSWLAGKEVLQCWLACPFSFLQSFAHGNNPLRLVILPETEAIKLMKKMSSIEAMPAPESHLKGFHYIDNIQLSLTKKENGEPGNIALSFLLAKDHNISDSDWAMIIDVSTSMVVFSFGWMWGFDKKIVKNPYPFEMKPLSPNPLTSNDGFQLLKCVEEQNHYEMAVSIQGLEIKSISGGFINKICLFFRLI